MSYLTEVLADGPVGYWRLGEVAGTVAADASGFARPGTYIGSPALAQTSLMPSDANPSVLFDGVNDYVDVTGTATVLSAAARTTLTVEAWVKTTHVPATERYILAKPKSAFGAYELLMSQFAPTGQVIFRVGKLAGHSPSNMAQITSDPVVINDGQPHHIVGVKTSTELRLYVDGVLAASQADPEQLEDDNNFSVRIGALGAEFGGGEGYMPSTIDEVAIYFAALSASRIATHYLAGAGVNFGMPIGWHNDQRPVRAGGGRY